MALFMNRMLFTLDDFKVDLLADTTWPARLNFRSLAALVDTTQRTFLAINETDGYSVACSFHHCSTHEQSTTY